MSAAFPTASAVPVAEPSASRSRRRLRISWILALMSAAMLLGCWALASPVGSSPDEDFHLASVWCAGADDPGQCQFVKDLSRGIGAFEVGPGGQIQANPTLGVEPCFQANDFTERTCPAATAPAVVRANLGLYPPLFYHYAGLFAAAAASTTPAADTVFHARLAVGVSVIALFALAFAVSDRRLRPAMLVSWVAVSMPLGVSLFASINPSAWGIAGVAAIWGPVITALTAHDRRQQLLAGGVSVLATVMAAGARADCGAYVALIGVLAIALLVRHRSQLVPALIVTACVAGGAVALLTSQQSAAANEFMEGDQGHTPVESLGGILVGMPSLWAGGTGAPFGTQNQMPSELSWLSVPVPPTVWLAMLFVICSLGFMGLRLMSGRKGSAMVVLLAAMAVVPGYSLYKVHAIPGELVQPRYLLPLVFVFVGVTLLAPRGRGRLETTTFQAVLLWVLLAVAGAVSLASWISAFTAGNLLGYDEHSAWMWRVLPPGGLWVAGSLAWAVLAAIAITQLRPDVLDLRQVRARLPDRIDGQVGVTGPR